MFIYWQCFSLWGILFPDSYKSCTHVTCWGTPSPYSLCPRYFQTLATLLAPKRSISTCGTSFCIDAVHMRSAFGLSRVAVQPLTASSCIMRLVHRLITATYVSRVLSSSVIIAPSDDTCSRQFTSDIKQDRTSKIETKLSTPSLRPNPWNEEDQYQNSGLKIEVKTKTVDWRLSPNIPYGFHDNHK